jgi:hypothetical protein
MMNGAWHWIHTRNLPWPVIMARRRRFWHHWKKAD